MQSAQLQWLTSYEDAVTKAVATKKPVLLDFFNPQ